MSVPRQRPDAYYRNRRRLGNPEAGEAVRAILLRALTLLALTVIGLATLGVVLSISR